MSIGIEYSPDIVGETITGFVSLHNCLTKVAKKAALLGRSTEGVSPNPVITNLRNTIMLHHFQLASNLACPLPPPCARQKPRMPLLACCTAKMSSQSLNRGGARWSCGLVGRRSQGSTHDMTRIFPGKKTRVHTSKCVLT